MPIQHGTMRPVLSRFSLSRILARSFSSTQSRKEIRDISELPERILPLYQGR